MKGSSGIDIAMLEATHNRIIESGGYEPHNASDTIGKLLIVVKRLETECDDWRAIQMRKTCPPIQK